MVDTTETEEVDFYNPHDALKTQPGRYLDDVEREDSEELRSVMEDRDPDYENVPANAGTPLVTKGNLPRTVGVVDIDPFVEGVVVDVTPPDAGTADDAGDTTTVNETTEQALPPKSPARKKSSNKSDKPARKTKASDKK